MLSGCVNITCYSAKYKIPLYVWRNSSSIMIGWTTSLVTIIFVESFFLHISSLTYVSPIISISTLFHPTNYVFVDDSWNLLLICSKSSIFMMIPTDPESTNMVINQLFFYLYYCIWRIVLLYLLCLGVCMKRVILISIPIEWNIHSLVK